MRRRSPAQVLAARLSDCWAPERYGSCQNAGGNVGLLIGLVICGAIVIAALLIVLKWILPARAYAAVVRTLDAVTSFGFKLIILTAACGILYVAWQVWRH